jgi:hypothetical protein
MSNKIPKLDKIKESEVEEALVSDLRIIKSLLYLETEPRLIARQLILEAGSRLDLLMSSGDFLFLIELKVTKYFPEHKEQILRYRNLIEQLQTQKQLPAGDVQSYLFVTDCSPSEMRDCIIDKVRIITYSPETVLKNYYQNIFKSTEFLRIKPKDYGVFTLGRINRALIELQNGEITNKGIAQNTELSSNTTRLHLQTAIEFGLVRHRKENYYLTDLGDLYVSLSNEGKLQNQISEGQAELLRQYVAKSPFASSMVFGIYAIVESAFLLARNSYPIEFSALRETFMVVGGKVADWKRDRAKTTATYTFLNFAIDLGLMGKIGDKVFITPSGFKFILMLQLHKSIEMIDSLQR